MGEDLFEDWFEEDPRRDYMRELIPRLEEVFGDRLTEDECLALMLLLVYRQWIFNDGFRVDGDDETGELGLFIVDAAGVVCCLAAREYDPFRMKSRFPAKKPPKEVIEKMTDKLQTFAEQQ